MRAKKWPSVAVPKKVALHINQQRVETKAVRSTKLSVAGGAATANGTSSKAAVIKKSTKAADAKPTTTVVVSATTTTETVKSRNAKKLVNTTTPTTATKGGKRIRTKPKKLVASSNGSVADALVKKFDSVEAVIIGIAKNSDELSQLWDALNVKMDDELAKKGDALSLTQIVKMVGGKLPESYSAVKVAAFAQLNSSPAFTRACKLTLASFGLKDGIGEAWADPAELAPLLVHILYFNKLYQCFGQVTTDEGRMIDEKEFTDILQAIGLYLGEGGAKTEFDIIDVSSVGNILFDDFCVWYITKVSAGIEIATSSAAFVLSRRKTKRPSMLASLFKRSPKKSQPTAGNTSTIDSPVPHTVTPPSSPVMTPSPVAQSPKKAARRSSYAQGKKKRSNRPFSADAFDAIEVEVLGRAKDPAKAAELWDLVDPNGSSRVTLAEINRLIAQKYPVLSNKSALYSAYKHVTSKSGGNEAAVETKDFMGLLANAFFYNKVYQVSDSYSSVLLPSSPIPHCLFRFDMVLVLVRV
jgi:hypothetical protein